MLPTAERTLIVFNGCLSHLLDFIYDSPAACLELHSESRSANKMSKYRQRGYMDSDRESERFKVAIRPQSNPYQRMSIARDRARHA